jgi:hypothetical protein
MSTAKKIIFGGFALIGGYLVLVNWNGFTRDINAGGKSSVNVIKAFQGR